MRHLFSPFFPLFLGTTHIIDEYGLSEGLIIPASKYCVICRSISSFIAGGLRCLFTRTGVLVVDISLCLTKWVALSPSPGRPKRCGRSFINSFMWPIFSEFKPFNVSGLMLRILVWFGRLPSLKLFAGRWRVLIRYRSCRCLLYRRFHPFPGLLRRVLRWRRGRDSDGLVAYIIAKGVCLAFFIRCYKLNSVMEQNRLFRLHFGLERKLLALCEEKL